MLAPDPWQALGGLPVHSDIQPRTRGVAELSAGDVRTAGPAGGKVPPGWSGPGVRVSGSPQLGPGGSPPMGLVAREEVAAAVRRTVSLGCPAHGPGPFQALCQGEPRSWPFPRTGAMVMTSRPLVVRRRLGQARFALKAVGELFRLDVSSRGPGHGGRSNPSCSQRPTMSSRKFQSHPALRPGRLIDDELVLGVWKRCRNLGR